MSPLPEQQQALDRLMVGRTTLVVAHRLATVVAADRLLVFDHGRQLVVLVWQGGFQVERDDHRLRIADFVLEPHQVAGLGVHRADHRQAGRELLGVVRRDLVARRLQKSCQKPHERLVPPHDCSPRLTG